MRNITRIAIAAVLVLFGLSTNAQVPQQGYQLTSDDSLRLIAKQVWVSAAESIVSRTGNQHAREINDLVLTFLVTVKPVEDGMQFLEKATTPFFVFAPITYADMAVPSVATQRLVSDKFFARFKPGQGIVVRDMEPCSDFWRGIMLLNEADHAYALSITPYNYDDPEERSVQESETHNFQNSLLSKIGGPRYEALLNAEVARLDGVLKKMGKTSGQAYAGRGVYNPQLDRIFTPAQSDLEKDSRQTMVWIHANFRQLERDFKNPAEAKKRKALFLFTVYRRGGILP